MIALSAETLDRFWRASEAAGAPMAHIRRPGITDAELSDLEAELGLAVPPELRMLWQHSAAPAPGVVGPVGACELTADFSLLAPETAVASTIYHRSNATAADPFPSTWLVFVEETPLTLLFVDCSERSVLSPVYYTLDFGEAMLASHSLGALFEQWSEQIERGEFWFKRDRWIADEPRPSRFPEEELDAADCQTSADPGCA